MLIRYRKRRVTTLLASAELEACQFGRLEGRCQILVPCMPGEEQMAVIIDLTLKDAELIEQTLTELDPISPVDDEARVNYHLAKLKALKAGKDTP